MSWRLGLQAIRIRLLDFPLERDEGEYAYAGQLIIQGIPPYKLAYNMKLPGIYLAYAAVMSVFGQTPAGIHLGLLAVHLATLAVLFLIARKFLDLYGAATATAAYALMTLSPAYLGIAAHATHFVMLPALLGSWMLFRMEKNGRLFDCLAGGCLFGIAFLMKQPGMFFGFLGGLYLGWISVAAKITWRQILARLGLYSLGCLLPFLAVCIWLKIAGVFPQFWFWDHLPTRGNMRPSFRSMRALKMRSLISRWLSMRPLWSGSLPGWGWSACVSRVWP